MYTILFNKDKQLVQTQRIPLYEGERNLTTLRFLIPAELEGEDAGEFRVILRYQLPNGKKYVVNLKKDENMYGEFYSYTMPVSQNFTEEPGLILYTLTFIKPEGEEMPVIYKSSEDYIEIRKREDLEMEAANLVWEADVSLFPRPGEPDYLYIDIGANKVYRWDEALQDYVVVGSDYMDIAVIEDS